MRRVILLFGLIAACREHEGGFDAKPAPGGPAATTRILYPSAPGSFVDLVANARHGVVGIRAASPVKSGPAAMFPGTPEQIADVALGKMPAPDGKPHPVELDTARHLIDVLAMLETKTKGNLDETESKLLASLVYDLRVAYVDAQNAAKK